MMGMTNDAIWVHTPRTAVMMAAMMGATPPRTPASCWIMGSSIGPTVEAKLPSACATGAKAGASVPVTKSTIDWKAPRICEASTLGSLMPTDESA